jgi:branched-chain amino acid transport system permease protein
MALFIEQLVNGLTVGAVYSLVALGYTMVYGVMRMINFAHGDFFMIGSYLGFTLVSSASLNPCQALRTLFHERAIVSFSLSPRAR